MRIGSPCSIGVNDTAMVLRAAVDPSRCLPRPGVPAIPSTPTTRSSRWDIPSPQAAVAWLTWRCDQGSTACVARPRTDDDLDFPVAEGETARRRDADAVRVEWKVPDLPRKFIHAPMSTASPTPSAACDGRSPPSRRPKGVTGGLIVMLEGHDGVSATGRHYTGRNLELMARALKTLRRCQTGCARTRRAAPRLGWDALAGEQPNEAIVWQ
jgi:hypothetical protein